MPNDVKQQISQFVDRMIGGDPASTELTPAIIRAKVESMLGDTLSSLAQVKPPVVKESAGVDVFQTLTSHFRGKTDPATLRAGIDGLIDVGTVPTFMLKEYTDKMGTSDVEFVPDSPFAKYLDGIQPGLSTALFGMWSDQEYGPGA